MCLCVHAAGMCTGRAQDKPAPPKQLAPDAVDAFLETHCFECHDDVTTKGDLNLLDLKFNPEDKANFKVWERALQRVHKGEMPPEKEPRPDAGEAKTFLASLTEPLLKVDRADVEKNGRVRSRRLTRVEYEYTLHDLLGIDIPLQEMLPEDPMSHGFETVAAGQQLSHHQLARYLDAADIALTEAFERALKGDEKFKRFCTPEELAKTMRGNYRGPDLRDGKSLSWPITLQFFGRMPETRVPEDGWYRITVKGVESVNAGENGSVWGTLRSGTCYSDAPMLYMVDLVEAAPKPRDLVYEAWIREDHMLELKPNDFQLKKAPSGATGGNVSFKGRDLTKQGFAGIAHRGIEIERIYPNADRERVRRYLFGEESADLKVDVEAAAQADPKAALDQMVARFARRAFRRPVEAEALNPYCEIGRQSLANGDSFTEALKSSYRAILCSPRFLTFIEKPGPLDDHAVAARLSYALWVSMPDWDLMKLANEGQLRKPEVLAKQVDRMLADRKSERFVKSFTDQWLKLKEIDFTSPDRRQFPDFDPVVQESMVQETRAFVAELIREDLEATNLVDSDFVFLNGRLARHYRVEDDLDVKPGEGLQKVSLPKQNAVSLVAMAAPASASGKTGGGDKGKKDGAEKSKSKSKESDKPQPKQDKPGAPDEVRDRALIRGGLITQGAVLKVTADGTSTSPVVRGVFVNERILGEHIPPPPPNVPAIEPDIRGATSIRDQLDKHRSNESCASCHQTIDPPGFVLENFDPVGGWRKRYGMGGKGVEIDSSGQTPDGREFDGLFEWQRIYQERGDRLAKGFAGQFLTYATGAPMRFSDANAVDEVVAEAGKSGYGMKTIIRNAVASPVFLNK